CPPRSEVENYREFITEIINDRNILRYCNVNHVAGGAYVEQQPPSEIAPAPTMEELQDLAGEATNNVYCSNITGEIDTSAPGVRDCLIRIQC
ncbi:hypothetical protein JG687_00018769, partial [Phytophthora cactorum]